MKKAIKVKCCKCEHEWESPIVVVGYTKKFYICVVVELDEEEVVEYIACPKCRSIVGAIIKEK